MNRPNDVPEDRIPQVQTRWRCLFTPGMDACRFWRRDDRYEIQGHAVFSANDDPASLAYRVLCAPDWSSSEASVHGHVGQREVRYKLERGPAGQWLSRNASGSRAIVSSVQDLADIDLGFTPATNTNALRRLRLEVGHAAKTTALSLDTENWSLKPLLQSYERLSATTYRYRSPHHDYEGELTVDPFGVVLDYPGLWRGELTGDETP